MSLFYVSGQFKKYTISSLVFITGLFIMSIGVALSVKADLGVSPISCIPYIFSLKFPLTMGETTIIMNIILIVLQIVILRRKYRLFQLIQLPVVFLFGVFIDVSMNFLSFIHAVNYPVKIALCLLSCIIIAFGVFLEVKAKLTFLPGEGVALAFTEVFGVEFGKSKIGTDLSMVITGIISSYMLMGKVNGIREGTVAAALLVGYIVRFYAKKIKFIDALVNGSKPDQNAPDEKRITDHKLIITISREYGSGGRKIGRIVSEILRIPFYDKKLIAITSEESGFTKEYIDENEQKLAHSLLHSLYKQNYSYINDQTPPLDAIFLVQSKIIRDLGEKESCVIVGRCSNFVLKDISFNVFIHADYKFRVNEIMKRTYSDKEAAKHKIETMDRERENYCRYYTGKAWKDMENYHLVIDGSVINPEDAARLIIDGALEYFKSKQKTIVQ